MFQFSRHMGDRKIGITLVSPFCYVALFMSLLFAAIPNIFMGLVDGKVFAVPPFPFCIWTILCLMYFFFMLMFFRLSKPYMDWHNSLYWPKRLPGYGKPRFKERLKAIALNDIVALQIIAPARPNPIFGAHQLNVILQDGTRQNLMRGPEKRLRNNGTILAECLGIPLLEK